MSSSSLSTIIIGTDPEPRVLDVGDQLMPQIMHRERGDWTLRGSAVCDRGCSHAVNIPRFRGGLLNG